MKTEIMGEGEPEYAIVAMLHGDEPSGKKAIERFKSENWELKKPVKLVIANEKAAAKNKRYLEADLNRSFPGDSESELHEERLAARLFEEVKGMKILDFHSTRSKPVPFAVLSNPDEKSYSIMPSTGLTRAVVFPGGGSSMIGNAGGITVEVGSPDSEKAEKDAYKILINFLAAEGVIDAEFEVSDPEYFEQTGRVDGDWEFLGENFQKIRKGETYARKGDKELVAEEDFYPVLMSTDGYKGMLGFRAKKMDRTDQNI